MKTKLSDWILVLSCFILVTGTFVLSTSGQEWENKYGKIEVYPDVSRELITQKQFYNVTWYYPDNDLDIAFRFNESLSYGGVYYWNGSDYKKTSVNHIVYNSKHYYVLSDIHFNQDEMKHGYWEYNTPVNSSGKWDMFIKLSSDTWLYAFNNDRLVHLDPWWNSSWGYSKCTDVCDNVPDYQVKVVVGNVSGGDVNCSGYCQDDFDDIRFTKGDNATELSYWMENYTSGIQATFWVNISDADVVCMYYGNDAVSTTSNGSNTFLFFDDFSGTTIDVDKWDVADGTPDFSIEGFLQLENDEKIETDTDFNFQVGLRVRNNAYCYGQDVRFISINPDSDSDTCYFLNSDIDFPDDWDRIMTWTEDNGAYTNPSTDGFDDIRANNTYMIDFLADDVDFFQNDVLIQNHVANVPDDTSMPVYFGVWDSSDDTQPKISFDWVFVADFDGTEPTFCDWTDEFVEPEEIFLTNPIPVNNSEVLCSNLSQLCIDVNFSCGSGDYVNITLLHDGNITFLNDTTSIVNGTYCLTVSSVNFTEGDYYIWWVNSSSSCDASLSDGYVSEWFNFTCQEGCGCTEELEAINWKLSQIQGDDFSSNTDSLSKIMSDIMINPVLMAIVLMITFFILAEKKEDYLLYVLSGVLALVMGVYYIILLEGISYVSWIGVILLLFGVYCFFLSLAYSLKKRSRK